MQKRLRHQEDEDELSREAKLQKLKECLSAIGGRIEEVAIAKKADGENGDKWRKHLWL